MVEHDPEGLPRKLLFVCTGNSCRSPMAEALARGEAEERGLPVTVRSAGVAGGGGAASEGAVEAVREVGLDLADHRSTALSEELVSWADLVLCMGQSHLWQVADLGGEGKARLITEFLPVDDPRRGRPVLDPVGGDLEVYRRTRELLRDAVGGLLDRFPAEGDE